MKPKIVAILGPTATGKSDLAVDIALAFNGEVISADSRQVYRGMDIGSGKITQEEMRGVPHHLLDVADPKTETYSVARFKNDADMVIKDIQSRGKLPILCGGTGFYIDTVIYGKEYPEVLENKELRETLSSKTASELFEMLQGIDPLRAESIDAQNPRRLIRAIEIAKSLGSVPYLAVRPSSRQTLLIGIETSDEVLRERISARVDRRLPLGMIEEVERLHKEGVSWEKLDSFGLEYRYISRYLRGLLTREEMIETLKTKIWQYARRQKAWFRRDTNIIWLPPEKISTAVESFLK